jgi:hypothetical protein
MEIIVENDFQTRCVRVYLMDKQGERRVYFSQGKGEMTSVISQTIESGDFSIKKIEPILDLPADLFDQLSKGIAKYLSQQGINTQNEDLLNGKLEATEKHLGDLRLYTDILLNNLVKQRD